MYELLNELNMLEYKNNEVRRMVFLDEKIEDEMWL